MDFKRFQQTDTWGSRGECFFQKQQHEARGVDTYGTWGNYFMSLDFSF